jgi:uncharacterized YccA/Bax inhibitor family protein
MIKTSSNPAFTRSAFGRRGGAMATSGQVMTAEGTFNKLGIMLLACVLSAFGVFVVAGTPGLAAFMPIAYLGGIVGLVLALVIIFKPHLAAALGVPYALCEGLLIGSMSLTLESVYPGIAIQAVVVTMFVAASMLTLYRTGVIKVNQKLKAIVGSALMGILMLYLFSFLFSLFGFQLSFMYDSSPLGMLLTLAMIVVAGLALVMDVDFVFKGEQMRLPKEMEWYGAFGIMVTLVWLYIEVLRLLAMFRGRN